MGHKVWTKVKENSEKLERNLNQGVQFIQQKSGDLDAAASAYVQKAEEFVVERSKSVSASLEQNSKRASCVVEQNCGGYIGKVSDSMQKGLDRAKATTEAQSQKVSKGVEYAKDVAESTRGKMESLAA